MLAFAACVNNPFKLGCRAVENLFVQLVGHLPLHGLGQRILEHAARRPDPRLAARTEPATRFGVRESSVTVAAVDGASASFASTSAGGLAVMRGIWT